MKRDTYCTVLCYTVSYCTTLYCTILHCTVLCCTALLYRTTPYFTLLYCTVTYCAYLDNIILSVLYKHNYKYTGPTSTLKHPPKHMHTPMYTSHYRLCGDVLLLLTALLWAEKALADPLRRALCDSLSASASCCADS
jgi:hypothetical protein